MTREGSPRVPQEIFDYGVPILGICYGQQVMMHQLGGQVESGHGTAEFGRAYVKPTVDSLPLLAGWFQDDEDREQVWMSHGDHVSKIAPGFEVYGTSPNAPYAITADVSRNFYAVQFHPEVHHTPNGAKLYENFVRLAGFSGDWTMGLYREQAIAAIREQVGDKQVICGLSGGVDSSVTAVLLHEAIGDQLTCVFVDHGLLRKGEAEEVVTMFRDNYNMQFIHADEQDLFLGELDGQSDPETKRKIIGKLFIDVFQKHANSIAGAEFLAQGTLYPDIIESVSFSGGPSVTIKSHHNVGGLPEKMGLNWLSRCASCSRMRCANWGASWVCLQALLAVTPSLVLVLRSAAPVRSPVKSSRFCAKPMRSTSTRSANMAFMTRSGRPLWPSCRCAPWA